MRRTSVQDMAYIGLFVALMAVCAWICIPMTVPVTLQTFAVFAVVAILGVKRGLVTICLYLILGVAGLPVFSGFRGGFGILFGPTGGYILGFVPAVLISGGIMKAFGKKTWIMAVSMVLGLIVCYAFGTAWFLWGYTGTKEAVGVITVLSGCVFPFIIPDLCKIALAIILEKRVAGFIR